MSRGGQRIVVIGLGYVGLPLAVALARKFDVVGYDIDEERVAELRAGKDRTLEVGDEELVASGLKATCDEADCKARDVYIVTVPTPVDYRNRPDFHPLRAATQMIARSIDPAMKPTIVYESTVYPSVTEEVCGPELEKSGNFVRGRDFRLGYSPERINPGDRVHTVDKITKIIAGEDEEVVEQLAGIYGAITTGGVFRAASIKAAEAAKVIENAQRDINIAFMNEVAQILSNLNVSVWDVIAACKTKWNFLPFEPGLVGGHCIGVDPYYLGFLSQQFGHHPQVILAGRGTNDGMGRWIADALHEHRGRKRGTVLVLGATFKENVPDLRNSKAIDVVRRLKELGHSVEVADPLADPAEVEREHDLVIGHPNGTRYDLVIGAVAHSEYRQLDGPALERMVAPGGTLADLKGMWRDRDLGPAIDRWTL